VPTLPDTVKKGDREVNMGTESALNHLSAKR
jgi:hypothetical protein